jgi:hypothetical protein
VLPGIAAIRAARLNVRQEDIMRANLLITAATIAILSAGSPVSVSVQAAGSTLHGAIAKSVHVERTTQRVVHPVSDITSFSSSSAPAGLNVGVNHPAKK